MWNMNIVYEWMVREIQMPFTKSALDVKTLAGVHR